MNSSEIVVSSGEIVVSSGEIAVMLDKNEDVC